MTPPGAFWWEGVISENRGKNEAEFALLTGVAEALVPVGSAD